MNEVKKMIPTIKIDAPATAEKLHEAGLLKLDITKAVNFLGWKPKLNFEETIQFTIQGYQEELNALNNIYDCRVKQIESYCTK